MDCLAAVVNRQPVTLIEVEIAVDFGLYPKPLEPATAVSASAVLDALIDRKVSVNVIEIKEPNLEAVFLQLTGRALRD